MLERINRFLDERNISNELLRDTIKFFILKHTDLYGDIIPFNTLMERLNSNLKRVEIINPESQEAIFHMKGTVGQYEGFDKNEILLYFYEDLLTKNSNIREAFVSTLIHELTHAAYSIKQDDYNHSEKQVFSKTMKLPNGKTPVIEGDIIYLEAIINYIAGEVFGKPTGSYLNQTKKIKELSNIIDSKKMVLSAFYSDEEKFKECFSHLKEGAYDYFTEGMKWLRFESTFGYKRGTEIMDNFFSGNIITQSTQEQIKELREFKSTLKPLKIEIPSFTNDEPSSRSR